MFNEDEIIHQLHDIKAASYHLMVLDEETRTNVLLSLAAHLRQYSPKIINENKKI